MAFSVPVSATLFSVIYGLIGMLIFASPLMVCFSIMGQSSGPSYIASGSQGGGYSRIDSNLYRGTP
jgi:hypothetical protein